MSALVLAGLLALAGDSLEVAPPCPGGAVVTRTDLEAAGAGHLREALRLAGRDAVSVHGLDALPTATAGVPFTSAVRVLVDGAPALRGGGIEPLGVEALLIVLGEVERVVLCPGDGVAGGAFGGPWIDVQTAAPARQAYAAAVLGNESGDPGPLRYLRDQPNVDRWGPDLEAAAVAHAGDATAWLSLRDQLFRPTDPAVFPRTVTATVPTFFPKRTGRTFTLAGQRRGLRARASVRRFDDLPFVAGAGREIPLTHHSAQSTVSGSATHGGVRVWGHGHLSHVRIDRPPWSALEADPSWSDVRADAALALEVARGGQSAAGGGRLEVVGARAPGLDATVAVGRAWLRAASSRPQSGVAMTLSGTGAGGGIGAGGQAEAWWRGPVGVRATLSARRTLPEERLDGAVWAGRGYRAPGIAGLEAVQAPEDVARAQIVLDGTAARLGWTVGADAQRGRALEAEGSALRAWASARWGARVLEVAAGGRVQRAMSGTAAYRAAWDRVPGARAWLQATVRPDDRLALWGRLEGVDGTEWRPGRTPAFLTLDLGVSKRAWRDHLRLSLGGRNVLGADERTHPLGARLEPRLFIRAQADL